MRNPGSVSIVAMIALIIGGYFFSHQPAQLAYAGVLRTHQPPGAATNTPTPPLVEADLLRAQLETMRDYDQRLIETVYWALGVTAALAVLVAGFSWFSNLRLYQRDRDALRDQVRSLSQSATATISEANTRELHAIREAVEVTVGKEVSSKTGQFESVLESLRSEISELRVVNHRLEAKLWEAEPVYANAFLEYTNALSAAVEADFTGYYPELLTSIIRVLGKTKSVTSWDSSRLNPILSRLPHDYDTEAAKIKQLLDEKLSS